MEARHGLLVQLVVVTTLLNFIAADHKVEHVFFRQKAEVHTTRSQWIIGLVLDFRVYRSYLEFTNRTLNSAVDTAIKGNVYFNKLLRDYEFRRTEYAWSSTIMTHSEQVPLQQYCDIMSGQLKELRVLQELHEQNWKDFLEITRIGHSEMERQRLPAKRTKRLAGLLMGIAGIFSGFSLFSTYQLKTEVDALRSQQDTIRTVLKESLSLINLTRMEVKSNRVAINQVIEGMGQLVGAFRGTVVPLRRFVITSGIMQTNIGMTRSLVTAESALIAELQGKVAKLATGRLSPRILPAPELVRILKGVEVEIPPELMLPQDPRERPFYYYTMLTTNTIALDNELVIAIKIPLLDVSRKLKVMEAIALPVPYTKTPLTAVYDLEFKNFAISTDGRQYVVLTLEDQLACGQKGINYCSLTSAIQEANSHSYCTLALYQRDPVKIARLCKVKVSNKMKLPTAYYVADGEWLVATNTQFNLRRQCVGVKDDELVQVEPPYTAVELESGCRALADVIELPIYFRRRQEYRVQREERIVSPPKNVKMRDLAIWKPVADTEFDLPHNLEKLGDIKDIPIENLVEDLERLRKKEQFEFPDNIMTYALIGAIIIVIGGILYVIVCKRKKIIHAMMNRNDYKRRTNESHMPMLSREETVGGALSHVEIREIESGEIKAGSSNRPDLPEKKRRAPRIPE